MAYIFIILLCLSIFTTGVFIYVISIEITGLFGLMLGD